MLAAHAFASSIQSNMLANSARVTWMINTFEKHNKNRKRSFKMKRCVFNNVRVWKSALHMVSCMLWQHLTSVLLPSVTSNTLIRSSAAARTSCTGDRMAFSASIRVSFSPLSTWSRVETGPGPEELIPAIFLPVLLRLTERWPGTRRKDAQRANARLGRDYETTKCCHSRFIRYHDRNGSIHRNGGWTTTLNRLFFPCCHLMLSTKHPRVWFVLFHTEVAHK